jgi:hypothetical protein
MGRIQQQGLGCAAERLSRAAASGSDPVSCNRSLGRSARMMDMRVIAGRVLAGKIEVETDLEEGTPVAILVAGDSGFHLTAEEEEELVTALRDIRSGSYEDGQELLRELKEMHRG